MEELILILFGAIKIGCCPHKVINKLSYTTNDQLNNGISLALDFCFYLWSTNF